MFFTTIDENIPNPNINSFSAHNVSCKSTLSQKPTAKCLLWAIEEPT